MPFTVSYADGAMKRFDFDAYLAMLRKRGIDWTNAPRVPEPGTSNRWLYVWTDRREAEKFCEEVKAEALEEGWSVRELPADAEPCCGPLEHVVIKLRRRSLGADFSVHAHSKTLIRRRFPQSWHVSSIAIEWNTRSEVEQDYGPLWDHIATMLTGLSLEQLATLEGYEVYDLRAEQKLYDSQTPVAV